MDAYLISEAHRAENGVCRCGRPLPCIAAQRAEEIMAETTVAARAAEEATRAAEAAAAIQLQRMRAITQELPVIRVEPAPAPPPPPVGARFYRERKPPRHRG
ncbi:hypothetical protein [Cryptosporangium sp. NPDC051539]|uniref:hypothetical protein n=1 Tax=Cryptosporangium sp. NPDC051539 TaxID=3363962 RepID=UPI003796FB53